MKKGNRVSLKPLRAQLEVLVNQANARVNSLIESGVSSRALVEAQRTLLRKSSRRDDAQLFRSDLKSRRDINSEFARVQTFLNDYTSTPGGVETVNTSLSKLKGAFGGEWQSITGKNYDTSRIDEDIAKDVFELYRLTVEAAGGWERAVGIFQGKESLVGYGSENLINAIYDMKINNFDDSDILNRALYLVEEGNKAYEEMSSRQVSGYDYGIIFDDETATQRRNYYRWRKEYRKNVGGV